MRRVLVPLSAVALALVMASPASARFDLSGIGTSVEPAGYYDEFDDFQPSDYKSTIISGSAECAQEATEFEKSCSLELDVRFKGKSLTSEGGSEDLGDYSGTADDDQDVSYARDWSSCKRSGKYTWTLTATPAADVLGIEGGPTTDPITRLKGSFRIPKCRKMKPRRVSASTAAAYLRDALPEDEFVSQLRCGTGRKSVFRCNVRRNNEYRECVSTETIRFYRTDQFGSKRNTEKVSYGKDRCRSF